jgi:crossover junction endodeoxyribonuclease RuvC
MGDIFETDTTKPWGKVIVGLDLSLTGTGWSQYEVATKELRSGVIASKLKGMARLNEIALAVDKLVDDQCEIYIENYGFGSKGQVVYQGELGGIIKYNLWKRNIKYHLVPPSVAKKFLTGKGNCDKSLILKELLKKYKIDVDDDNQADATVLGLIGRARHGIGKYTKAQLEAIKAIE